jgi:hypothetical protein
MNKFVKKFIWDLKWFVFMMIVFIIFISLICWTLDPVRFNEIFEQIKSSFNN